MRIPAWILVATCGTALAAGPAGGGPCDMKTVEKGWYCAPCDRLLDASGVKDESCLRCKERVQACDICVRSVRPGEGDQVRFDRARIVLRCEGCRKEGVREGACTAPACVPAGKRVLRTCSKSGMAPHITP